MYLSPETIRSTGERITNIPDFVKIPDGGEVWKIQHPSGKDILVLIRVDDTVTMP